jgi:signal transduction histidine kinase
MRYKILTTLLFVIMISLGLGAYFLYESDVERLSLSSVGGMTNATSVDAGVKSDAALLTVLFHNTVLLERLRSLASLSFILFLILMPIVALVSAIFVSEPIRIFSDAVREMLDRRSYKKLPVTSKDEIGQITGAFNQLVTVSEQSTEVISIAVHELRTPLTAIKLFIGMIVDTDHRKFTKQQREYIADVADLTEQSLGLLTELMNSTRLEQGRMTVSPTPTDLVKYLESKMATLTPIATEQSCTIVLKKQWTPTNHIPVDTILFGEVITNLLTNAIKYSQSGSRRILVTLGQKKENVVISVKDSGIGIPKADQPHIFEKFYRATNAKKSRIEGSGLGLHVAQLIMETSGGSLSFLSRAGRGSTFTVTFPKTGMQERRAERGLSKER